MKYKCADVIDNILDFKVYSDVLLFKKQKLEKHLFESEKLIDTDNWGYNFWQDFICLNREYTTTIININTREWFEIPVFFTGRNYYENTFIVSINLKKESRGIYSSNYLVCQLQPFKVLYELPNRYYGSGQRHINKYFQTKRDVQIIKSLSLLNGEYEWEADLNFFGEIRKLLGVIEEKLWVVLYKGGENQDITKLIALDIHTGDIIIELPESLPLHNTHISIIEEKQTILSIWGMKSSHHKADSPLVEIDGKTGKIIRNYRIESLFEANLKMGLWKYLDNKIFFVGAMDYLNSTHVGVLDYNTLDLLWYEEVVARKAGLKEIQVTGDKIFCLDIGHQLHIYEKVGEDKL